MSKGSDITLNDAKETVALLKEIKTAMDENKKKMELYMENLMEAVSKSAVEEMAPVKEDAEKTLRDIEKRTKVLLNDIIKRARLEAGENRQKLDSYSGVMSVKVKEAADYFREDNDLHDKELQGKLQQLRNKVWILERDLNTIKRNMFSQVKRIRNNGRSIGEREK